MHLPLVCVGGRSRKEHGNYHVGWCGKNGNYCIMGDYSIQRLLLGGMPTALARIMPFVCQILRLLVQYLADVGGLGN